ncbi:MAG: HAD family phosphatase [Bacteroidetes bacterium]|nr:HAD family phosphatase [Bacteroidota bacterium]
MPLKNIIFDLGNVIIDLDIPATENELRKLLGPAFKGSFQKNEQHGIFRDYELGLITEDQFIRGFREILGQNIPAKEIIRIWNALLAGITKERFELLENLRNDYRVFLLSNTNYTHIQWVYKYLKETWNITDWDNRFFDKPYYSHEINLRKPDREIYEYVLRDSNMNPSETLFIDDNKQNVLAAAELGIHILHHPEGEIADILPGYLESFR